MISLPSVTPCKKCKKHPYCPAIVLILNSRNIGEVIRAQEEFVWVHIKYAVYLTEDREIHVDVECDRVEEGP